MVLTLAEWKDTPQITKKLLTTGIKDPSSASEQTFERQARMG